MEYTNEPIMDSNKPETEATVAVNPPKMAHPNAVRNTSFAFPVMLRGRRAKPSRDG